MTFSIMTHSDPIKLGDEQKFDLKTKMANGRVRGRYTQSDSAGDSTGTVRIPMGYILAPLGEYD